MDAETDIKQLKEAEQQGLAPACYCWPLAKGARSFWGVVLVVAGAFWLLESIGLAAILWPLALVAFGAFLLLRQTGKRGA